MYSQAREELVHVPASALLTVNSIPDSFKNLYRVITIHGLLAAFLALEVIEKDHYSPWRASWPNLQDFRDSMPMLWPETPPGALDDGDNPCPNLDSLTKPEFVLPPAIGGKRRRILEHLNQTDEGLLYKQKQKFAADWKAVSEVSSNIALSDYTYCWLIVNTRSFYFDALGGKVPESHDDRMILCPFVDCFNHNDHGVSPASGQPHHIG